jgi:O-antigen/teichoic acid export membrane protein
MTGPSLYHRASRALGWSVAGTIVNRLSTLAIGIALARVLGPESFGTFAVALVMMLAVLSFNELGVSLAIVRWPGEPREIAPTVATLSLASSVLVYVACYLGAPYFADALGDPTATPVIRVLCLSVIVSGLVATPAALLQRSFRQGRRTVVDVVNNWGTALVSIVLALNGFGAMSLAIGQLTGSVAGAVLFCVFAPEGLRLGFNPAKARALLKFGLPLAGSSIVVFATNNVDRMVVGAVLGPTALGYYALALNLASWPVSVFSQPVRGVAPAALARLQHDPPAMRSAFISTSGLLSSVTLPACVLLAAAAGPLISFVYGDAWSSAADVLGWLGLLAALRILFELVYDYFVVLAKTRIVFVAQVIWFLTLLPAMYFASARAGLWAAGAAQFAVALLVVCPLYLYGLKRSGVSPRAVGARLVLPILGGLAVAAITVSVRGLVSVDLLALAIAGVATLGVIVLLAYRMRHVLGALRSVGAEPELAPVGVEGR